MSENNIDLSEYEVPDDEAVQTKTTKKKAAAKPVEVDLSEYEVPDDEAVTPPGKVNPFGGDQPDNLAWEAYKQGLTWRGGDEAGAAWDSYGSDKKYIDSFQEKQQLLNYLKQASPVEYALWEAAGFGTSAMAGGGLLRALGLLKGAAPAVTAEASSVANAIQKAGQPVGNLFQRGGTLLKELGQEGLKNAKNVKEVLIPGSIAGMFGSESSMMENTDNLAMGKAAPAAMIAAGGLAGAIDSAAGGFVFPFLREPFRQVGKHAVPPMAKGLAKFTAPMLGVSNRDVVEEVLANPQLYHGPGAKMIDVAENHVVPAFSGPSVQAQVDKKAAVNALTDAKVTTAKQLRDEMRQTLLDHGVFFEGKQTKVIPEAAKSQAMAKLAKLRRVFDGVPDDQIPAPMRKTMDELQTFLASDGTKSPTLETDIPGVMEAYNSKLRRLKSLQGDKGYISEKDLHEFRDAIEPIAKYDKIKMSKQEKWAADTWKNISKDMNLKLKENTGYKQNIEASEAMTQRLTNITDRLGLMFQPTGKAGEPQYKITDPTEGILRQIRKKDLLDRDLQEFREATKGIDLSALIRTVRNQEYLRPKGGGFKMMTGAQFSPELAAGGFLADSFGRPLWKKIAEASDPAARGTMDPFMAPAFRGFFTGPIGDPMNVGLPLINQSAEEYRRRQEEGK